MAKYSLLSNGGVRLANDDGSVTFIPPSHPLMREFVAWQSAGNVPDPVPPPPPPDPPAFNNPEAKALVALLLAKGIITNADIAATVAKLGT